MELPINLSSRTTTAAVATQSGSHLFQNAAGFDIVGGQFVLGDVHNHHTGSSAQANISPPLCNILDDCFSESEVYCSQLLRRKRGFPLYVPEPQINLPGEYRLHGVAIGDVGRVTPEGIFDFFFNIFLPQEHPINANRTPEGFVPMPLYDLTDLIHHHYGPGDYVSTPTVQKVDLEAPSDLFPGGHFVFSCDGPQGAVLALPDGAHLQKLENVENMRTYTAEHANNWYKYINGARGRGLANGDLYLVTGCEKAQSWGMASYSTVRQEFELFFRPTAIPGSTQDHYRWSGAHGRKNPARRKSHDPPSTSDPVNHTTFIHGLSISLATGLWGKLFGTVTVETSSIADLQMPLNAPGGSRMGSSQGSLFSWSWGFLGGSTAGGKHHAGGKGDVILSDLSPIAKARLAFLNASN
ncbi:hypothetical protein B0H19DRAFT_197753 [Mycena capillaripes]|nr:hypothetical protein B0H19DRAFT_197753 [Mycena capillaripes]